MERFLSGPIDRTRSTQASSEDSSKLIHLICLLNNQFLNIFFITQNDFHKINCR